jgi:hypothetical protein
VKARSVFPRCLRFLHLLYAVLAILLAGDASFLSAQSSKCCLGSAGVPFGADGQALPAIRRHPAAVRREECFSTAELSPEDAARSEQLLLAALDSEALYTLVGDLKPVSEGFHQSRFPINPPVLDELQWVKRVLANWKCGTEIEAGALVFGKLQQGERYFSAWVARRSPLDSVLNRQKEFFETLGLSPVERTEVVLLAIERAETPGDRWRGFGLVFGYPQDAVEFFVRAGNHQAETGEFIQRDFRNYPTFSRETGGFVYAVPKLSPESNHETQIRTRTGHVLEAYRQRRELYIGPDKPGAHELLRDWWDDGTGWCHPDHATQKLAK